MTTTYYACEPPTPPLLLRRTGAATDEAFLHGTWQPTKIIIDFMFGHEDNVTEISEQDARTITPHAFA
jgi:hypothetical protein